MSEWEDWEDWNGVNDETENGAGDAGWCLFGVLALITFPIWIVPWLISRAIFQK